MVEWSSHSWSLFWIFPIETKKSPLYICRFLHAGKEVHRIAYGDLPHWDWPGRSWDDVPKVTRRWNWSTTMPKEMLYRAADNDETYQYRVMSFFHLDTGDEESREGAIAYDNAIKLFRYLEVRRSRDQEAIDDLQFPVIRRMITVDLY
jgi:hypothetical protein